MIQKTMMCIIFLGAINIEIRQNFSPCLMKQIGQVPISLVAFNGAMQIGHVIATPILLTHPSPYEIKVSNFDVYSQVFEKEKLEVDKKIRKCVEYVVYF